MSRTSFCSVSDPGRGCFRSVVLWLVGVGLGLLTGCSETSLTVSHVDQEPFTVYQQLARLEVTSDRLFHMIAA